MLVAFYALIAAAVAPPDVTEDVLRVLGDIEYAGSAFVTTYDYRTLKPRVIGDETAWDESVYIERQLHRMTFDRGRFKIERDSMSQSDIATETQPFNADHVIVWDSARWTELAVDGRKVNVYSDQQSGVEFDCLSYFNSTQGQGLGGTSAVCDLLKRLTIQECGQDPGECRIRLADELNELVNVELVVEWKPTPRLSSLTYDILVPRGQPQAGAIKTRIHYSVSEWMMADGRWLPSVAYRDGYLLHSETRAARGLPPIMSRSVFRRIAYEGVNASVDATVDLPLQDGDDVSDHRVRMRYRIGSTDANLDGVDYVLATPASNNPDDVLAALYQTPGSALANKRLSWASVLDLGPGVGAGMLAFAVTAVILGILERRRRQLSEAKR